MILRNIIITIFIIFSAWLIFNPCNNSYRVGGKVYRASSPKTAQVLQFMENISDDFADRLRLVIPELGLSLKKRLVNSTFIEIDHIENPDLWAWNVQKGRELAFRFYKENGELEKPEEQICSLLHELAHSVVEEYQHDIPWQSMNNYFQNFPYENGRIKDYYISLLVRDNELYKGIQVNAVAECDGNPGIN
jgi:hypothetical protein